jgi:hypothetical protein
MAGRVLTQQEQAQALRAMAVEEKLDKAAAKINEALKLLDEAADLAKGDDFASIKTLDAEDISNLRVVLRVGVVRNLNQLRARWSDIAFERKRG